MPKMMKHEKFGHALVDPHQEAEFVKAGWVVGDEIDADVLSAARADVQAKADAAAEAKARASR